MGFQPTVRQSQPDSPDFVRSYLVGIVNESNTFFSQFIIQGNVNVGKPQYAFILQFLPVAATVRFQEFVCQQGRKQGQGSRGQHVLQLHQLTRFCIEIQTLLLPVLACSSLVLYFMNQITQISVQPVFVFRGYPIFVIVPRRVDAALPVGFV